MFIAELFTVAKIGKHPKCPSLDEWIKKHLVHLYSGILHGYKKERTLIFWDNMGRTGHYDVKQNKPVRERQISRDLTNMLNLMNKIDQQTK